LGEKKGEGLIFEFEDNFVRCTYSADQGQLDEIATRGWEYLELIIEN